MGSPVAFRQAERADIPQLAALMNAQYARKKNEAYFLWQYFEGPLPTALICAESAGRIAGMFGLQQRELRNGAVVGQAIDLLVAPEFRGTGVFAEMGNRAVTRFPRLDALCVLPNANGKRAVEKSLQWKTLGKIDVLVAKPGSLRADVSLRSLQRFKQPVAQFAIAPKVKEWRFLRHPEFRYEETRVSSSAYALTKVFTDPVNGTRFGDIVVVDSDPADTGSMTDLVRRACTALESQGVAGITTWALPHTALRPVTEALGFESKEQERYFCVRVLNPAHSYLEEWTSWHLMQADTEMF